jgi:zinc protease
MIVTRLLLLAMGIFSLCDLTARDYVVAVDTATAADPDWARVVETLRAKHDGRVLTYTRSLDELREPLRADRPRHLCLVQRPGAVSRDFVAEAHRMARDLDDDPYGDVMWGILTGFDATNALAIARQATPLEVRRVAGGTEFALEMVEEGLWYDELKQFKAVEKRSGQSSPIQHVAPADTTESLVRALTEYRPELFITSGHATERDWQIGYTFRNGYFKCDPGTLYGIDTAGVRYPIQAPQPKVYLAVGNCLMGHIDGPGAMALAWLNSAGVHQMVGYTVETWYGYMGWGLLDYFLEQPGRYTLAEAFFASQQALLWRLGLFGVEALRQTPGQGRTRLAMREEWKAEGLTPRDAQGLLHDRDTVAFYGDPGWVARMAPRPGRFDLALTEAGERWTFTIIPRAGEASFAPVNTNGAQRGHRPFFAFLPRRVQTATVVEGADLKPVITDDFILVPNPRVCDTNRAYRVVFDVKAH